MLRPERGDYGLGLFISNVSEDVRFGPSGGTDGFRAQVYGYTQTGQGALVMTNSDNGGGLIDEIVASVATVYDWPDLKPVESVVIAPDPTADAAVTGVCQLLGTPRMSAPRATACISRATGSAPHA